MPSAQSRRRWSDYKYPLEGEVFISTKPQRKRLNGQRVWVRDVLPTEKYRWNIEDEKIMNEKYSCMRLMHSLPASAIPPRCFEIVDSREAVEASRRVEQRVREWLAALCQEYEPTEWETLTGIVWKHRSRRIYIVPVYPRKLLGTLDYEVCRNNNPIKNDDWQ